ncbi:DUF4919 domain-containing protein [Chryseobacterium takakiae]|uniref:DUF4919 domain-containing protein n=1 Tax=Chryseobacterium takakiae TaxID=1302685 RepID=A0A1M4X6Y5_9FLAO|nr:DUF4919 domain-containing protein [Chryseobacterium takakiae]SHE89218.1 protein of unknown function [Chryseobacterium takakiae]
MKKIIAILILLTFKFSFAQINVEEIKKKAVENPQENFYKYLEIFKQDPSKLTQQDRNQMYYGSRFVAAEYSRADYNKDYEELWKIASRKGLSKAKAQKILPAAEEAYHKNPLNREILASMVNIYQVTGEKAKAELCILQNNTIIKIIDESGTGQNENLPICVITLDDMMTFAKPIMMLGRDFKQKDLKTDKSSMMTEYSNRGASLVVKCVGCLNF